jgi:hypothetical protein
VTTKSLTIRNATPQDSPSIARLFQLAYGQSSHPCKDAQHVREGIGSGSTAWRVAVDQDRVVACVTLIVNAWNHSLELARAVTLPEICETCGRRRRFYLSGGQNGTLRVTSRREC